jgi:enoyl-CoA hydratase/carnithine racemase
MPESIAIDIEADGAVAIVTLQRPARLNAYTPSMGVELFTAFDELPRRGVRAIVVTGVGRAFCAGADLHEVRFGDDEAFAPSRAAESRVSPWRMRVPVIAAINGPAVGIGATLPLGWDLRIASERATLAFPFVRRGLVPEANSTWILPRLVGLSAAMDLLLTGRTIDAEEARALGLVSRVVPHDRLLDEALTIARQLATECSPTAIAATRRLIWRQLAESDPIAAKAREDRVFMWAGARDDVRAGVQAFLERRTPQWSAEIEEPPLDD